MAADDSASSGGVRHVALIRLDPSLDDDLRAALERDLHRLVDEHPHAIRASLHRDLGRRPHSPVTATWMVCLDFSSMAEFEGYLAHPTHRHFFGTHEPSMAFITAIQVPLDVVDA